MMFLFLIVLLGFVEPQMSSKKASFDGKMCVLEEEVILDHPLGCLKTDKAILEKGESTKFSFEKAWLENHVEVNLKSGAVLKAQRAEADLIAKTLLFSGKVDYQEKSGLQILAEEAFSTFIEKDAKFSAQKMSLKGDVKAHFPEGRMILCHEAYYAPEVSFEIHGKEGVPCQLTDLDLDVKTSHGVFDLISEEGSFFNVAAELVLPISGVKSHLYVQADEIHYSEKTHIIQAPGRTLVTSDAYGLKSELDQFKVRLGDTKQVEEAILEGQIDILSPGGQSLSCPGVVKLHEGKQQLVLKASEGNFITCKAEDFYLKSTRARLFYKQEGQKFLLMKLELEDKVQLYDLRTDQPMYGRAEKAHLFLADNRLHLYGEGASRVLYVDEALDLSLSAPEVVIQKNDEGKLAVQGIGAVRFSFSEEEEVLIEKIKKMIHE